MAPIKNALYELNNLNTLCGDDVCPSVCNLLSATKFHHVFVKFGIWVFTKCEQERVSWKSAQRYNRTSSRDGSPTVTVRFSEFP